MTLDETIEREYKISEENQKIVDTQIVFDDVSISELYCDDTDVIEEHLDNYKKCAEYHKQIAGWLEELKMYKSLAPRELVSEKQRSDRDIEYHKGFNNGYNKAIDDFAEACKQDVMCQTFGLHPRNIDEIAEKLKKCSSDDVCEWKNAGTNDNWKPSCEPNATFNVFGVAWFNRCPYCGKKIKVVE